MATLSEVQALGTLSGLPKIPRAQVQISWIVDFYDGPLQGVADVGDEQLLFVVVDRDRAIYDDDRRTLLVRLDARQLEEEEAWQKRFSQHVVQDGRRMPSDEHLLFYKPYQAWTRPDYGENTVVGWFSYDD